MSSRATGLQSSRAQKSLIVAVSVGITSAFFIDFCALVFQCGCHSLWAGAAATCNIHRAGQHHCPWCTHNPAFAYAAIVIPQGLIGFWPLKCSWWTRLALTLAAFPVFGGMAALVYGWASGYWN